MERKELERTLRAHTKDGKADFICIAKIAEAVGCSRNRAAELMEGSEIIPGKGDSGKQVKLFFIPDVAKKLNESKRIL